MRLSLHCTRRLDPMMALTALQPMQANALKMAGSFAPCMPNAKRVSGICASPVFGPSVLRNATGKTPSALKTRMTITEPQNPRPKKTLMVPRTTVATTVFADHQSQMVSLISVWPRSDSGTRSMPVVSNVTCFVSLVTVAMRLSLSAMSVRANNYGAAWRRPRDGQASRRHASGGRLYQARARRMLEAADRG